MKPIETVDLSQIEAARGKIADLAIRTPLLRLAMDGPAEVWLKLENLQSIGSFKLRGAGNAMAEIDDATLEQGVYTASAGNMAQGVAWVAKQRGIACSVVVPDHAPETKLRAIDRLGARIVKVPFDRWWKVLQDHRFPDLPGRFIHPVSNPAVIAGNGTIGLEILEQLPGVDTVLVPYGGGGLSCGIASALAAHDPTIAVHGCEVETAAPLRAAMEAGAPTEIAYTASFVDGIGSKAVLPEMWTLAQRLLAGSKVVSLEAIARAIRLLVERARVVAEGAGAASVAAALEGIEGAKRIVCVVSGGNLDRTKLASILRGELP